MAHLDLVLQITGNEMCQVPVMADGALQLQGAGDGGPASLRMPAPAARIAVSSTDLVQALAVLHAACDPLLLWARPHVHLCHHVYGSGGLLLLGGREVILLPLWACVRGQLCFSLWCSDHSGGCRVLGKHRRKHYQYEYINAHTPTHL